MDIIAHSKKYSVNFESNNNFIEEIAHTDNALWVIDQRVYALYLDIWKNYVAESSIMLIEALEENKVIDIALQICERMTNLSAKRNSTIISVGGGIIQDITGFAANILYRGVNWIFIPTTVLAACDSCIGSKTSLNYKNYKNLLGTFYPPNNIYIYPAFFKTLSRKDFYSGLGEIVKFNIMAGIEELDLLEKELPLMISREGEIIEKYVHKSLEYKKGFVEKDEYDKGCRIYLNFAHTFGHAFESVTNYAIPHGTAVAMGMIVADDIAYRRGNLDIRLKQRIEKILQTIIDIELLQEEDNLDIGKIDNSEEIVKAIRKDKKQTDNNLTAIIFKNNNLELEIIHDLCIEEISCAIAQMRNVIYKG